MDAKRLRNSSHHKQTRIALATFYAAFIGQINLGLKCKLLLGQLLLLTKAPYVFAQYEPPILHCGMGHHLAYSL